MVTLREVEARLTKAGFTNRFWARAEVRELQHILMADEEIVCAVNGKYENGFALLLATDRRLLLVDKKPLFLSMEDLRYDMISEVDYFARLMDATVSIRTINTTLTFMSIRQRKLRELTTYMQKRVMELRQHNQTWQAEPGQQIQYTAQPVPKLAMKEQEPSQYHEYPVLQQIERPTANPAMMSTEPQGTFYQRAVNPYSGGPLTVRRRAGRFQPHASGK